MPTTHYKVTLIGNPRSGGTSLFDALTDKKSTPEGYSSKSPYQFRSTKISFKNTEFTIDFCDAKTRAELHYAISRIPYLKVSVFILTIDLSEQITKEKLNSRLHRWRNEIISSAAYDGKPDYKIIIAGTKLDQALLDETVYRSNTEVIAKFARDNGLSYIETSSHVKENVNALLEQVNSAISALSTTTQAYHPQIITYQSPKTGEIDSAIISRMQQTDALSLKDKARTSVSSFIEGLLKNATLCSHLKSLTLTNSDLQIDATQFKGESLKFNHLQKLNLHSSKLSAAFLELFSNTKSNCLTELDLSDCDMSSEMIDPFIRLLENNKELNQLNLMGIRFKTEETQKKWLTALAKHFLGNDRDPSILKLGDLTAAFNQTKEENDLEKQYQRLLITLTTLKSSIDSLKPENVGGFIRQLEENIKQIEILKQNSPLNPQPILHELTATLQNLAVKYHAFIVTGQINNISLLMNFYTAVFKQIPEMARSVGMPISTEAFLGAFLQKAQQAVQSCRICTSSEQAEPKKRIVLAYYNHVLALMADTHLALSKNSRLAYVSQIDSNLIFMLNFLTIQDLPWLKNMLELMPTIAALPGHKDLAVRLTEQLMKNGLSVVKTALFSQATNYFEHKSKAEDFLSYSCNLVIDKTILLQKKYLSVLIAELEENKALQPALAKTIFEIRSMNNEPILCIDYLRKLMKSLKESPYDIRQTLEQITEIKYWFDYAIENEQLTANEIITFITKQDCTAEIKLELISYLKLTCALVIPLEILAEICSNIIGSLTFKEERSVYEKLHALCTASSLRNIHENSEVQQNIQEFLSAYINYLLSHKEFELACSIARSLIKDNHMEFGETLLTHCLQQYITTTVEQQGNKLETYKAMLLLLEQQFYKSRGVSVDLDPIKYQLVMILRDESVRLVDDSNLAAKINKAKNVDELIEILAKRPINFLAKVSNKIIGDDPIAYIISELKRYPSLSFKTTSPPVLQTVRSNAAPAATKVTPPQSQPLPIKTAYPYLHGLLFNTPIPDDTNPVVTTETTPVIKQMPTLTAIEPILTSNPVNTTAIKSDAVIATENVQEKPKTDTSIQSTASISNQTDLFKQKTVEEQQLPTVQPTTSLKQRKKRQAVLA